ncbi:MAG: C39 family peptidase [Clostridia bacterium]|nr:C39 family peptidase [Clostridia bacterium]
MSNKKRFLSKVTAGLCAACLGTVPAVHAESQFGDWEKFYSFNKEILEHTHSKKLMKLPIYRQASNYTSGVACVLSILRYTSYEFDIREDNLKEALHATEENGTEWYDIVDYLNAVRLNDTDHQYFKVEKKENMTVDDLIKEIKKGHPVICAIQAWNWDENGKYSMDLDYSNEWECGHWVIAIGYLRDNIIFMDPSTAGNYTYIPKDKLVARWHDYNVDENNQRYDIVQCGLVVKIDVKKPDCEKHADHLYGLM